MFERICIAIACLSWGCLLPNHVDVTANGTDGALDFEVGPSRNLSPRIATQVPVVVSVARWGAGWEICGYGKSGRFCDEHPSTPLELLDASCDDGGCTVENAGIEEGKIRLRVTAGAEGVHVLRVRAQAKGGETTWEDSAPLSFAASRSIWVGSNPLLAFGHSAPVLVGTRLNWCTALLDAYGHPLLAPADVVSISVAGDGWTATSMQDQPGCAQLVASGKGRAQALLDGAGLLRSLPLGAVAESEVMDLALWRLRPHDQLSHGVDAEEEILSGPFSPIRLELGAPGQPRFAGDDGTPLAVVLALSDGTQALGSADALMVVPEGPDSPVHLGRYLGTPLVDLQPHTPGVAAIGAELGGHHFTLPVQVTRDAAERAPSGNLMAATQSHRR